jgi:PLP dependent protein
MPDATIDRISATPDRRLEGVIAEIGTAAKLARRETIDIALIAVSKTRSADEIAPLIAAGQRVFGENRVQEAAEKWPKLKTAYPDIALHLIGQLQSNKAEEAVALFDCIHSLDRMSLLTALGKAMRSQNKAVPCFIQVNIGAEEQKGGCAISDVAALLEAAGKAHIPVAGLMCLPPADIEPAPFFALLAELAARHGLVGLSMGMSGDFATAIMLGATHIRVGTALFGARD